MDKSAQPKLNFIECRRDSDGSWKATAIRLNAQKPTELGRLGGSAPTVEEFAAELEKQGFTVGKLPDETTKIRAGSAYLLSFVEKSEPTAAEKLIAFVSPSQMPKKGGWIDQEEIERRKAAKEQPQEQPQKIGWAEINRRIAEREAREGTPTDSEKQLKERRQKLIRG
jgi:hypothetical protein